MISYRKRDTYMSGGRIRTHGMVEHEHGLDIRQIHKRGLLRKGRRFPWEWRWDGELLARVQVYVVNEDRVEVRYGWRTENGLSQEVFTAVQLKWTECNFGGDRAWFRCPGCRRRVAILYVRSRGLKCRRCLDLTYASQAEGHRDRLMRRIRQLRDKVGREDNLLAPFPPRPKGMHARTYERLRREDSRLQCRALDERAPICSKSWSAVTPQVGIQIRRPDFRAGRATTQGLQQKYNNVKQELNP